MSLPCPSYRLWQELAGMGDNDAHLPTHPPDPLDQLEKGPLQPFPEMLPSPGSAIL